MRVVCKDKGSNSFLTIGKEYNVLLIVYQKNFKEYWIVNDSGSRFCYGDWYFMSISDYRKIKLDKIGKL